jgi:hypothetical protein
MESRRKCEKLEEEKAHTASMGVTMHRSCPSPVRPKPSAISMSHDMDISPFKSIHRETSMNDESCLMMPSDSPQSKRISRRPAHRQTCNRRMSMMFPPTDSSPDIIKTKRLDAEKNNCGNKEDNDDSSSDNSNDSDTVDGDEDGVDNIDTLTIDSPERASSNSNEYLL